LAGDPAVLAGIYDRFANSLHDTAAAMLNNRDDAADVLQDVIVIAAEKMAQLRDPERLKPWLFAILRSEVYRRTKQRTRSMAIGFSNDDLADALGVGTNQSYTLVHLANLQTAALGSGGAPPTQPPAIAPPDTTTPPPVPDPSTTTTTTNTPGQLVGSATVLGFGNDSTRSFMLSNPGDEPVGWTASRAAPFTTSPPSGTLAPGSTTPITIGLERSTLAEGSGPSATVAFTGNVGQSRSTTCRMTTRSENRRAVSGAGPLLPQTTGQHDNYQRIGHRYLLTGLVPSSNDGCHFGSLRYRTVIRLRYRYQNAIGGKPPAPGPQ
jgi:hypothetical protein